jgi:biopolymer transport protein ExbB
MPGRGYWKLRRRVPSGSGYASIAALKGSDGSARSLENTGINSSPAVCRKTPFFDKLRAVRGCTGIFDGCKPLKMGAIRKPRCRTGRPNAAERRDARERRANGDGEKAMDGFFDNTMLFELENFRAGHCIFRFSIESGYMVEIVKSGGWLMAPIILCAIVAMGIVLERFWTLQQKRVIPEDLTSKVWGWVKMGSLDQSQIQTLHQGSPLGQILAAGLINRDRERVVMKDSIEDTGRHVVHELERYLDTLGTVAAISPLLGLLGTVIGMVKVFAAITTHGVGNPTVLAGGIAEALITTAAGLTVAIPALIGYRYYRNRVDTLVVDMEKEAIKLVEALHRRQASKPGKKK